MNDSSANCGRLCDALSAYAAKRPERQQTAAEMLRFIRDTPDCFNRSCRVGHLTGSAWLLHPAGDRVLLTLHHKLQRWLQPGGHADGESDMLRVALREAEEESGISGLVPLEKHIFDLDIHAIPARPCDGEAAHFHYDVRYLLQAPHERFHLTPESDELRWWTLDEIRAHKELFDASVLRMAQLWKERMAASGEKTGENFRGGGEPGRD